jgi:hypothetical protein
LYASLTFDSEQETMSAKRASTFKFLNIIF